MTQTLIEQLEKLQLYWPGNRGEMYPAMTKEGSRPRYVGAEDLRAIIEQHKQEVGKNEDSRKESYSIIDRFLRNNLDDDSYSDYSNCLDDLYHSQPSTQPDIVAELVKALGDDAYAATFQSMAGYRTALIAKVKGVVG